MKLLQHLEHILEEALLHLFFIGEVNGVESKMKLEADNYGMKIDTGPDQ